jgi:hypothetical protein
LRRKGALEDRVEERLTERAATFEPGELRAVLLEQSAGELAPVDALARSRGMVADRRVLPLEGGRMTTLAIRAKEQAIERRVTRLAKPAGRDVSEPARTVASDELAERIGSRLSDEQTHALEIITGPERRRRPRRTSGHRQGRGDRRRRAPNSGRQKPHCGSTFTQQPPLQPVAHVCCAGCVVLVNSAHSVLQQWVS